MYNYLYVIKVISEDAECAWWAKLKYGQEYPEIVHKTMNEDPDGHFQASMIEFDWMRGSSGLRCSCCPESMKKKAQTRYMCIQCTFRQPHFPRIYAICQIRPYNSICWEKHKTLSLEL